LLLEYLTHDTQQDLLLHESSSPTPRQSANFLLSLEHPHPPVRVKLWLLF
jgi:hypothetical protein